MSDDNIKDSLRQELNKSEQDKSGAVTAADKNAAYENTVSEKTLSETGKHEEYKVPVETKDAANFVMPMENIKQESGTDKPEKMKKPVKKAKEKKPGEKSDKVDMKTRIADGAEYVKKTVRMIREATEQFRLDAEYEIPNRPEDVRYDDIVTPLAIKTDDTDGAENEDFYLGEDGGEIEGGDTKNAAVNAESGELGSDAQGNDIYAKKTSENRTSENASRKTSGKSVTGKSQGDQKNKNAEVVDKYIIWRIIVNLVVSIIGIVLVIVFVPKIIKFFLPFIIAALLAAIATPLVKLIRKKFKITQKLGSAIVIILVIAAVIAMIYGIIVFLISQITKLVEERQVIVEALRNMMARIGESLSGVYEVLPTNVQKFVSGTSEDFIEVIQEFANTLKLPSFADASSFLTAGVDVLLGVIVCFIAAYFFTAQQAELVGWLRDHTPESTLSYFRLIRDNFKKAIGGYFKAQFKIMLVLFVIMFIWFEIMDISFSALCAFGVAFLDFLPVFGMGAIFWPWIVIDIIGQKYSQAVLLAILYVICQLIRQLLQPKLVGDAVEMNPLETLVFMFIGYKIAGMWGLILGIPVGMILISLYKIGTFDRLTKGIKIIAKGINDFRKY